MSTGRPYAPEELAVAVASSHSWRGVLRALGRSGTSAGTLRTVRRQVDALSIDYSQFRGQRRWSDRDLTEAVSASGCWTEVLTHLNLSDGGGNMTAIRGHARRLALDVDHLTKTPARLQSAFSAAPDRAQLRSAAGNLAAAWFQLRGYAVLWPQEPCRYDFVVHAHEVFQRIQVKTTTYETGGTRAVRISSSRGHRQGAYDPDEIDHFFVIDEDLDAYLIPMGAVAGYTTIWLRNYTYYLVARAGRWLDGSVNACASPGL